MLPITIKKLESAGIVPHVKIAEELMKWLNWYLPIFGINTFERLSMFFAQILEETNGFDTLREYGTVSYFTRLYEHRMDIGNTQDGDGALFCGRAVIMVTGRKNYKLFRDWTVTSGYNPKRLDFEKNPELLEQPQWGVLAGCWFWQSRKLNEIADRTIGEDATKEVEDFLRITKTVNGGYMGLSARLKFLKKMFVMFDDEQIDASYLNGLLIAVDKVVMRKI